MDKPVPKDNTDEQAEGKVPEHQEEGPSQEHSTADHVNQATHPNQETPAFEGAVTSQDNGVVNTYEESVPNSSAAEQPRIELRCSIRLESLQSGSENDPNGNLIELVDYLVADGSNSSIHSRQGLSSLFEDITSDESEYKDDFSDCSDISIDVEGPNMVDEQINASSSYNGGVHPDDQIVFAPDYCIIQVERASDTDEDVDVESEGNYE